MSGYDKLANALQVQVVNYLNTLDPIDVARLGVYFGSGVYEGKEPNDIQKAFVDKFIGAKVFDKFIEEFIETEHIFVSSKSTKHLIIELTSYITFYASRKLIESELQHQLRESNESLLHAKVNVILSRAILEKSIKANEENIEVKATDVLVYLVNELNGLGFADGNLKELCFASIKSFK